MTNFSKIAGAVAIAATMGVATVAPAAAQGFGFQVSPPGSGFSFQFGVGNEGRPGRYDRCISQRSIGRAIADQGYRNVRITDYGRRTTEARGTRGGYLYEIIADSCSGDVIDRDRIRRS